MNYLKKLRGQRPQRELARTLKIRVPDYSRYENGRANPTPEQMKDLCEYHRCNVGALYDREDWDYDLIDPVKPRETRRSGKGTRDIKNLGTAHRGACKPHTGAVQGFGDHTGTIPETLC